MTVVADTAGETTVYESDLLLPAGHQISACLKSRVAYYSGKAFMTAKKLYRKLQACPPLQAESLRCQDRPQADHAGGIFVSPSTDYQVAPGMTNSFAHA